MTTQARLGERLRSLRQERGWTLEKVSERSGISRSTLSKVERGKLQLTYDRLHSLGRGLEVPIADLFGESGQNTPPTTRRSITRASDGYAIETSNYFHRYLNTEVAHKGFVPLVVELKARTLKEFGEMVQHPGEEFIFVLEGEVELHTEHYSPVRLLPGDSVFFDSTMRHAYLTVGETPARCVGVCTDFDHGEVI